MDQVRVNLHMGIYLAPLFTHEMWSMVSEEGCLKSKISEVNLFKVSKIVWKLQSFVETLHSDITLPH